MTEAQPALDSEELLHLAINASENSETEKAIGYLKRALDITPDDGKAIYLLGSLHADIGLYDRAIEEMTRAVQLDPGIDVAHFQLGLLYLTSQKAEEATNAWSHLDYLDESNYLYLFKEGLISLINDDFTGCIQKLKQGIQNNQINAPLNNDMLKMIQAAEKAIEMNALAAPDQAGVNDNDETSETQILSAYNNNLNS